MHIYDCADGTQVPSVTTILQILGSPAIIRWANWLGFKHLDYEKELDRAANNGTVVHMCTQHVVDPEHTEALEFKNDFESQYYAGITKRFTDFISRFHYETIFTEKSFASTELGYGGTIDWYARLAGLNMLFDFKTSKQVRLKHLLQLGGYMPLLESNGYPVDAAAIIIVNDRTCQMYPINKLTLLEMHQVFEKLVQIYPVIEGSLPAMDANLLKQMEKE